MAAHDAGFETWGTWLAAGAVFGVVLESMLLLGLTFFLLTQILILERPRWRPWRWTTPWMFPNAWREDED